MGMNEDGSKAVVGMLTEAKMDSVGFHVHPLHKSIWFLKYIRYLHCRGHLDGKPPI